MATTLVTVLATPASAAAESVESPIYKSWSRSKVGTVVTIKSVTVMKGRTVESMMRYKLVELTPEKATIELAIENKAGEIQSQKLEHRRDFPLLPGVKKEDIGKPVGASEKGEETIKVAGKDYKTQWYVTKARVEAGESIARTWTTPDFPGMLLKSVIEVPAGDKVTTLEVIDIKTP
jgi:hypothetical protein